MGSGSGSGSADRIDKDYFLERIFHRALEYTSLLKIAISNHIDSSIHISPISQFRAHQPQVYTTIILRSNKTQL